MNQRLPSPPTVMPWGCVSARGIVNWLIRSVLMSKMPISLSDGLREVDVAVGARDDLVDPGVGREGEQRILGDRAGDGIEHREDLSLLDS